MEQLIENWRKRKIEGFFCADKDEAAEKLLELVPFTASVGFSGSQTLEQIGIIEKLEERGNKIFNPYKSGLSREQSLKVRKLGASADFYLASANALSKNGELVFLSAYGNRTSGIAYADNVIVVCGVNKIMPNLEKALERARELAAPLNCKRLNWESACLEKGICREEVCFSLEYKRMCCQALIIEGEIVPRRLKVILVDESLGF